MSVNYGLAIKKIKEIILLLVPVFFATGFILFLFIWKKENWFIAALVGAIYTVAVGLATFMLAQSISKKQNQLQNEIMFRIFGTLGNFDEVYHQVISLVDESNKRIHSRLAIMVYWLWFGLDQKLNENPGLSNLENLNPNDSKLRALLEARRIAGLYSNIVVYSPINDADKIKGFIKALFEWKCNHLLKYPVQPKVFSITDINGLFGKYKEEMDGFEKKRLETTGTKFGPIRYVNVIPMLMFAAIDKQSNWSRGIVCLAETEALINNSKVGGFLSEDPKIVEIILSQIPGFVQHT